MRSLAADPGRQLARAVRASFEGLTISLETTSRDWASATFTGARHVLVLRVEGESAAAAAEFFLAGIEEREFQLSGHILADIALTRQERSPDGRAIRLELEALTIESS